MNSKEEELQTYQAAPELASTLQPEPYWTESRNELAAWFRRHAPSLGELFEGSLRIIFAPSFPGRTRFVAHAVREIRNRLPNAITGPKTGGTFQWKNRLDEIVREWQRSGFALDGSLRINSTLDVPASSPDIPAPRRLMQRVAIMLKEHVQARERPEEAATRLFEGIAPENHHLRDSLRPLILHWLEITDWFVKQAHDSGTVDDTVDTREFRRQFELFETTLSALVCGFFKTVEGLDEILEDTNSRTD